MADVCVKRPEKRFHEVCHHEKYCSEFITHCTHFNPWLKAMSYCGVAVGVTIFQWMYHKDWQLTVGCSIVLISAVSLLLTLQVKRESLLATSSIGLQLTSVNLLGNSSAKFFDVQHIKDVVINEAITMHQVVYYLTVVLRENASKNNQTTLIPLFQHSSLLLDDMITIHQRIQLLLFHNGLHMVEDK